MRAWQSSAGDEFAWSRTAVGAGSVVDLEKGFVHDSGRQVDEMPREKQSERNVNLNEDFIRSVFLNSKGTFLKQPVLLVSAVKGFNIIFTNIS